MFYVDQLRLDGQKQWPSTVRERAELYEQLSNSDDVPLKRPKAEPSAKYTKLEEALLHVFGLHPRATILVSEDYLFLAVLDGEKVARIVRGNADDYERLIEAEQRLADAEFENQMQPHRAIIDQINAKGREILDRFKRDAGDS